MTDKEDKTSNFFFKEESENLQIIALTFSNGLFIAISEKPEPKLGTTAISMPLSPEIHGKSPRELIDKNTFDRRGLTTATILGSRNEMYVKALAEKVVQSTQQLVYITANFPENNDEFFNEAIQLLDEFLKTFSKRT